jgi:hypothetical protein
MFCLCKNTGIGQHLINCIKGNQLMKNLMNILTFAFALVSVVTLPSFASSTPQSAADCQKTFAGDKDKIRACIVGLKK